MGLFPQSGGSGGAPEPARKDSAAARILRYTWFLVGAAALVIAWLFFSQWDQNRRLARDAAARKNRADAEAAELMGGNRFEILQFYAYPSTISRGDSVDMCYSVSGAKTVKLDPPVAEMWPSQMRCVDIKPEKTTDYTLTIFDAGGSSKTQKITVTVAK